MKVTLHWAERFLNWYPFNTKLYIRGARGASQGKAAELQSELFHALAPFLDKLKKEAELEGRKEYARELKRYLPHLIQNTPHSCQTEEHCCALHAAHKSAAEAVVKYLEDTETPIP